ncbi:archaemetzincin-2-like [Mizuhopecten yessoensis]|uniref:Archaemetzincin-2 n=1 Tax=Mizuhopecten yessoensis TaxID=6573 RepID=A0A210QWE9_MIZYE|nr:archaemetzincin-2-like [Mizuhopecten yessoensis]XP_021347885.1 archaemetzincin-2-like [Mizuhopecten yessoensis]OWF53097.1 Archaemetzincin-2 [Mizuhopecten yessoensis]
MGSTASKDTTSPQQKFLIGNLSRKSDVDLKFYQLSYHCLQNSPSMIDNRNRDRKRKGLEKNRKQIQKSQGKHVENEINHLEHCDSLESRLKARKDVDEKLSQNISHECVGDDALITFPDLFVPILGTKKLMCTQTYVAWRSIMDLEKLKSLFVKKRTIYLVQVDSFPDFLSNFRILFDSEEMTLFELAQTFLQVFFTGMRVKWIEEVSIAQKKWNINSRHHEKTGKFQYLVTDFFPLLPKVCPKDGYCIMGLTWADLYPKEELNFVLGEAHNPFKSGMVSFGRFEPKSYNEETHKDVTSVTTEVVWKLLKCLSHELCHLFGMAHCDFFSCTMNGSGSVGEAMDQPLFLCPVCTRKLQHICKFDILERYEKIGTIPCGD